MLTYEEEVVCAPRAGTLYDVLELILDRGMVIDVFARVSLVGIEILKIDARIVVASVDTYLRFAEACNRLDLEHDSRSKTVPEMFGGPMAKTLGRAGAKRAGRSLTEKVHDLLTPEAEDEDEDGTIADEAAEERPRRRPPAERAARRERERPARPRPRRRAEEDE
ncbi:gas vesicle structural protein GvpA [Streptomyces flavalbus]|uniref:Gas vesicle protein A n=1 Tax=Streptomyces flavalbus TaxID=2665155 RepID=A0ABW2WJJ6_9ACTN